MQQELGCWLIDEDHSRVSATTLRTALKELDIQDFRARRRPKTIRSVAAKRLRCARESHTFDWKRCTVRISDECSVQPGSGRNTEWSFGYPDDTYGHDKVVEMTTDHGKQQMVWASIWITRGGRVGRPPLVIMERDYTSKGKGYTSRSYIKALDKGLLPYDQLGDRFLQDNARVHTSQATKEYLERHGIWAIDCPPYYPDLNPVEHLWWALELAMHQAYPGFDTISEAQEDWDRFCEGLEEVWLSMPDSLDRQFIHSMPHHLAAVEKAPGYRTRF